MKYAKLIDDNIYYAPRKVNYEDKIIYNPTDDIILELGYKEVEYTDQPIVEEGYIAVEGWEELEDKIKQIWTIEKGSDEIDDYEALNIILGGL